MRIFQIFFCYLLFHSAVLNAQEKDTQQLPRVLIIGDSMYQQAGREAVKELKGRAEVVFLSRQPHEICNTWTALEKLDEWLGDGRWDLIHFNFGFGDLIYRAPGMKSFRAYPKGAGGVRTTGSEDYEKNLKELVRRFKATGAQLVWANTTPIRSSKTDVFEMGSEIQYNEIAEKVMNAHKVPTNDMYSFVLKTIDMNKPGSHGVDPFSSDKKPIHQPIVDSIVNALNLPPKAN